MTTPVERRRRLTRYLLRTVVLAGVAGGAWFLGSQAADAMPAHPTDGTVTHTAEATGASHHHPRRGHHPHPGRRTAPRTGAASSAPASPRPESRVGAPTTAPVGTPSDQQCDTGPLPVAPHALGTVLDTLTRAGDRADTRQAGDPSGTQQAGDSAGTQTCDRPGAGSHDGTVRPRTTPVANSTPAAGKAAPDVVPAVRPGTVPPGGATPVGATPSENHPTPPTRSPSRTAGSRGPGSSVPASGGRLGAPFGELGQVPLGPVADATRTVTRPLTTTARAVAAGLDRSPATGALTRVTRPVTTALADTAGPVTDTLAGPLTAATRPATGLLDAVTHPLPGVADIAPTPLAGVLVGRSGLLSGILVPSRYLTPHRASGHPDRTALRVLPRGRQYTTGQDRAGNHPFATWTEHTGVRPVRRASGHLAPGVSGPAPRPAYPGPDASNGGMVSSSGLHTDGGACAPATSPAVPADSASRIQPRTAQRGPARLGGADPVVSPD